MKTEDLNFLEAVKALDEGRCKKIEAENGCSYKEDPVSGLLCYVSQTGGILGTGISLQPKHFLGKWKLIGVKKRTEQRTIKYWLVIWKDGNTPSIYFQYPDWTEIKAISQQVIPLSTTYDFELPEEE